MHILNGKKFRINRKVIVRSIVLNDDDDDEVDGDDDDDDDFLQIHLCAIYKFKLVALLSSF